MKWIQMILVISLSISQLEAFAPRSFFQMPDEYKTEQVIKAVQDTKDFKNDWNNNLKAYGKCEYYNKNEGIVIIDNNTYNIDKKIIKYSILSIIIASIIYFSITYDIHLLTNLIFIGFIHTDIHYVEHLIEKYNTSIRLSKHADEEIKNRGTHIIEPLWQAFLKCEDPNELKKYRTIFTKHQYYILVPRFQNLYLSTTNYAKKEIIVNILHSFNFKNITTASRTDTLTPVFRVTAEGRLGSSL